MQVVSTLLVFQAIALLAGALPQQASTEVLRARSNEVDRFVASSLQDSKLRRDPGLFDDILSEVVPEGPVIDGCQVCSLLSRTFLRCPMGTDSSRLFPVPLISGLPVSPAFLPSMREVPTLWMTSNAS